MGPVQSFSSTVNNSANTTRNTQSITSIFAVCWTKLSIEKHAMKCRTVTFHRIQIPSKFQQYFWLSTNRAWNMCNGHNECVFCKDTFITILIMSMIRELRARQQLATSPLLGFPIRNHNRSFETSQLPCFCNRSCQHISITLVVYNDLVMCTRSSTLNKGTQTLLLFLVI